MTAAVGVCERFYRQQAVRFSLFRHPPRGGSADATFPRWGKERAAADSPDVAVCFWCCCRGVGTPPPTLRCCGFVEAWVSSKAPSPIPSPSGGGCRPQGRQERENVTGPRCGNDRNRGRMRTIFPSAGGHVLPLPSSASRGGSADATFPRWGKALFRHSPHGGCHLPPLGIGVKLTITGDFKQSKQQKQAKSKDVFALKKHKTNEAFQVKKSSYQHESSCGAKQSVRNIQPLIPAITTSAR